MIGKTISHYKILEKLGEGGMGVVYLAEDTRLERKVAIKFLPWNISGNSDERRRFEIEAKAAAALNHSNIATIHAIEEAGDEVFIVMEHIEGDELRNVIGGSSWIEGDVVMFAVQIGEGLRAAHARHVVHRDIKSANIMITRDRRVKIMDFGLAKVRGGASVTKIGTTVGTIAYMSPEQARGDEVDERTDIWSFGVVLFEMLAGRLPFKGEYDQVMLYSILNEEPQPLPASSLHRQLEPIIRKALTKDPAGRYQSVDDMLHDLRAVNASVDSPPGRTTTSPAPQTGKTLHALAVLPFANIRSDPETDFLGFALADQIIGALTYVANVVVRPSSSVRKYQNHTVDIAAAGTELKVDFVLTGSYLKESDNIRLNVELVNVTTGDLVWRESIRLRYENAFSLQDIVSEKVIRGLEVQFSKGEQGRMKNDVPRDPVAYEYYLRGVSYAHTNEGDRLAIQMLQKAVDLDPGYAPAFSELGFRLAATGTYALQGAKAYAEAEKCQLKALSLNSGLLSPLGWLAALYTESGRTEKALEYTARMLSINPNSAHAHYCLSYLFRYAGMLEESVREGETVLRLDPHNPVYRSLGNAHFYLGDYKKAMELFALDKGSVMEIAWRGYALFLMGEKADAMELFAQAIALEPEGHFGYHFGAIREGELGRRREGLIYAGKWEQTDPQDSEAIYNLANTYGFLGDSDRALRLMEKAINGGFFCSTYFPRDPMMSSQRHEDRFRNLVKISGAKTEAFREKVSMSNIVHSSP